MFVKRLTIIWLTCLLLLTVITHSLFSFTERYEPITAELLSPVYGDVDSRWIKQGSVTMDHHARTITLSNNDPKKNAVAFQEVELPDGVTQLMLKGDISTTAVAPGLKSWERARVVFLALDSRGKWIPAVHEAIALDGNNPPQQFSHLFILPDNTSKLRVAVQLLKATGLLRVSNLTLTGVEEQPTFTVARRLLMGCWVIFLTWSSALVVLGSEKSLAHLFTLFFAMAILGGTLISLQMKSEVTHQLEAGMNFSANKVWKTLAEANQTTVEEAAVVQKPSENKSVITLEEMHISSWSHGILFMLLTIAALAAFHRHKRVWLLFLASSYAVITETLQYFAVQRTPNLVDLSIDLTGIITGLLLLTIWQRMKKSGSDIKT